MDDLKRMFKYDTWANRAMFESLQRAGGSVPPRAVEIMSHIAAVQDLWHARIQQLKKRVEVWPKLTLDRCDEYIAECAKLCPTLLESLTSAELDRQVDYVNSLGESWSNTVGDILHHVIMHGVYHRGQIATHMRNAKLEPAQTDFILAVRQGFISS